MTTNITLLKKIKALAERGEGGEKESAKRLLKRLLNEKGVSEKELEDTREYYWRFRNKIDKALLIQTIAYIQGMGGSKLNAYSYRGSKRKIYAKCTEAEYDKITVYYNIYLKDFKKLVEDNLEAFIYKNNIYGIPEDTQEKKVKDFEESERILRIAGSIQKSKMPHGQIGYTEEEK